MGNAAESWQVGIGRIGQGRLGHTSSVYTKIALNTHLLGCLAHCTHRFLNIEARVTRPAYDADHPLQTGPAVQADIAYAVRVA